MKNNFILNIDSSDNLCPADAIIIDFRRKVNSLENYPQNIELSSSCISFFKKMADVTEESDKTILFKWDDVPSKYLPKLIVKIRKEKNKFFIQYIKELGREYGKDNIIISGKQRKGKNKFGKVIVSKYTENNSPKRGRR